GAGVGYVYGRAAHSVDFPGPVFRPGGDVLDSPYVLHRCGHSHGRGFPRSRAGGDESGGGTPRGAARTWVPGGWQRRVIPDWLGRDVHVPGRDGTLRSGGDRGGPAAYNDQPCVRGGSAFTEHRGVGSRSEVAGVPGERVATAVCVGFAGAAVGGDSHAG